MTKHRCDFCQEPDSVPDNSPGFRASDASLFQGWASSLCEICIEFAQQKGFDITKLEERKRLSSAFKTDDFKRYRQQRVSSFKTDQAAKAERVKVIKVLTYVPAGSFEAIAPVMAVGTAHTAIGDQITNKLFGQNGGFMTGSPDPDKAFEEAVTVLRQKCAELDGDAVIGCTFEHRICLGKLPILGHSQAVEIWAYGTAAKLVSTPHAPIVSAEPPPLP